MTSLRRRIAAAAILLLSLSIPAAAQKRTTAPATAGPPALITGPLADRVPADTNFYLELTGARTESERAAVAEMYGNLVATFAGLAGGTSPVSLEEFQMFAASNIAVSFTMPDPASKASSSPWLAIVRAPDSATVPMISSKLASIFGPVGTGARAPSSVTVRGRKIVSLVSYAGGACYAVAGNTMLVGDRESIRRALEAPEAPSPRALSSTSLYREGRARVGDRSGLFTLAMLPASLYGKPDATGSLLGLTSLKGIVSGSQPWSPGSESVTLVAIERDGPNLLSILANGPAVTLRQAEILPSDTGVVASISVDLPAIDALLRTPGAAKETGYDLAAIERQIGMSVRDQLLPALGSEVTFGLSFVMPPASMSMGDQGSVQESPPIPDVSVVALLEAKQPDIVRNALERILASKSTVGTTVRDVGGTRVLDAGKVAVAVVDGIAILGEPREVDRVLAGRSVEQTLGTSRELVESRSRLSADTIAVVHPTPIIREMLSSFAKSAGILFSSTVMGISSLDDTVVRKDPLGLTVTTSGGANFSVATLGIIAAIAIPSLLRSRRAAEGAPSPSTRKRATAAVPSPPPLTRSASKPDPSVAIRSKPDRECYGLTRMRITS